ncbi:hypothetical protein PVK06_024568 [Gossypium arboreum]|uniref:Uncharacterized protein n=1 Tax=Gossypium arboreum TaxID=29729 RepID=A0ABR0PE85_GOSAR|nr:hypothetical protein PVK06_024568 [Gossypium arboreum]
MSDGGIGILATIERQGSLWDRTHHWYCLRHNASNYYGQYRSTTERRQVTNMVNDQAADYLYNIPFEQWIQAYNSSLRYGHMITNLAECINSILKGTHHLPITLVVGETYFRLAALFPK